MKCPNCSETLLMTERLGIEIDYCPSCRGVWLDKGELDKILEQSGRQPSAGESTPDPKPPYTSYDKPGYDSRDYRKDDHRYDPKYGQYGHGKPHKKKSFLDDLFDF